MDRTKVLHGPRAQTYGETNYLEEKLSFGQNQGIAWSSESNLWRNQLLKNQVLNRIKVLHGPRTQTYGETNYLDIKFWTKPRYCMILGLKPMGKPTTLKKPGYQAGPNTTRDISDDAYISVE